MKKSGYALTCRDFLYIIASDVLSCRGGGQNEDDIPTKKETAGEGSRFQTENENCRRKKSIGCKEIKRKKEIVSIGHIYVVFSSIMGI